MLVSRFARVAVLGAALCALPSLALAQNKPFEPTVGQAGKDVVWVPTPQALVEKMLDLAKVTPQDYLMDLGSGDGRTVITAAKRGLRAPDDIAVVGFDDLPWADLVVPSLTTVAQPTYELGRTAGLLLKDRIASPGRPPSTVTLRTELHIRATSAPKT